MDAQNYSNSNGIRPVIQNVVATMNVNVPLELKDIAMRARNAEYNPKRFLAVIMRMREPKTTALIFNSGRIVVTGAKSIYESKKACRRFGKIIKKCGYTEARITEYKVQNMVGSCDVQFPIMLERLEANLDHTQFCSYEPELFPGLIYRFEGRNEVALVFSTGKIVITGGKDTEMIYKAFNDIYPLLLTYRRPPAEFYPTAQLLIPPSEIRPQELRMKDTSTPRKKAKERNRSSESNEARARSKKQREPQERRKPLAKIKSRIRKGQMEELEKTISKSEKKRKFPKKSKKPRKPRKTR